MLYCLETIVLASRSLAAEASIPIPSGRKLRPVKNMEGSFVRVWIKTPYFSLGNEKGKKERGGKGNIGKGSWEKKRKRKEADGGGSKEGRESERGGGLEPDFDFRFGGIRSHCL